MNTSSWTPWIRTVGIVSLLTLGASFLNAQTTNSNNLTVLGYLDVTNDISFGTLGNGTPAGYLQYTNSNVEFTAAQTSSVILWQDGGTNTPNNKLRLDGSNNLVVFGTNGSAAITFSPNSGGGITLANYGSGIVFSDGTELSSAYGLNGSGGSAGYPHAFLELPINLINIDDPTVRNSANGTNIDIAFMTNPGIPPNTNGRDTNINCVAWISGNNPTNTTNPAGPRMPWLQAQALGFTNVNTYWKLQVTFHDTNGYPHRDFDTGDPNDSNSSGYLLTNPFTHPGGYTANMPDVVTIPSNTNSSTYVSGWRLVSNGVWNIYEDPDFQAELSNNGFFGGDATLSLMISNSSSGTIILPPQNFYFRIAGENPDPNLCYKYLTNPINCGSFPYAYAIIKHETKGEGGGLYYNHFLNYGIKASRKEQPGESYEHWFAAVYNPGRGFEGKPNWNDDTRYSTSKAKMIHTLGSGGYGLSQLTYREDTIRTNGTIRTGDSNYIMPRSWIWNWQANVSGLTNELSTKVAPTTSLYNKIVANYPSFSNFPGDGFLTAKQGILVGLYNGTNTFGILPTTNGNGNRSVIVSPWVLERDDNWILSSSYVSEVESCK